MERRGLQVSAPVPLAFAINTGDLVGGVDVVAIEAAKAQFDRYIKGAECMIFDTCRSIGTISA